MATQAWRLWVNAGRPFRLAMPIIGLRAIALRHNIAVLGTIGNDEHLEAEYPEDHTPYSYSAWPVPLPGYVVTAIDLDNTTGLATRLLTDAKTGRAPWVKYLNFSGHNYSIQNQWNPVDNPDQHLHVSVRSDYIDYSLGSYDPFTDGGDDMSADDVNIIRYGTTDVGGAAKTGAWGAPSLQTIGATVNDMKAQLDRLEAVIAGLPAPDPVAFAAAVAEDLRRRLAD